MSRLFITQRELDFISKIDRELLQRVTGEVVHYYAISLPETRVDNLYNEAVRKVWSPPVHCNARVLWENQTVSVTDMGPDTDYRVEVYLHPQELVDRNLSPKEGDFVEFGDVFFEVATVTKPDIIFGQVNNKTQTKLTCVKAREGQFAAGGRSSENVSRTHPSSNSVCCLECGM